MQIGLLGLGTVGGGTVNVLARNREEIARRAGRAIEVAGAAVRDPGKARICATEGIALCEDPFEVVGNPEIAIVVEVIGGTGLARELVLRAIDQGKHVVTANKALIALHGNEVFAAAHEKGVTVAFESAVAGGVPIIKAIREGLAGNRIDRITGIVNGTSNYILSEMREHRRDFDDVLAEAQRLGYAEADPTFDVGGIDAAHKLTILSAIAFGIPLQHSRVHTEGIADLHLEDIGYAEQLGYRIRHLGIARRRGGDVELRVHPTLVPQRHLLAGVDGVMNAVLVDADAVGPTLYYGAGAGAEATASAVVADLVDVVRALTTDPENRVPHLAFQPDAMSDLGVLDMDDAQTSCYLRMTASDRPGVLAEIATVLGRAGISIEAVVQPEPPRGAQFAKLVMLTHTVREGQMRDALLQVANLDVVNGEVVRLRVEHLEGDSG